MLWKQFQLIAINFALNEFFLPFGWIYLLDMNIIRSIWQVAI